MRSFFSYRFLVLLLLSFFFQKCSDTCKVTNTYTYYQPVYTTSAEVRNSVRYEAPHELKNPGRIYFKDNFLFVNETGQGIHVINNTNPASPTPVGFLKIPGNYDLAISGNYLYADSFIDMVIFDVTDKTLIKEFKRIENVFDHSLSYGFPMVNNGNFLTSWKQVKSVNVVESNCSYEMQPWGGRVYDDGIMFAAVSGAQTTVPTTSPISQTGIGGSTARFTITQGNLYALDTYKLEVIDISQPANPQFGKELNLSWDVETLFPYKDKLFIGSRSGMSIYDLKTPANPVFISKYEHLRSCDPVVVDDTYAYVTLRNGSSCTGFTNQLEVIDITNLSSPKLVKAYPMTNPYGLGIDQKLLFVCDGSAGLKIYDAADVSKLDDNQLAHYPGISSVDVIPFNTLAMMIANDGLYQYNYADPKNIYLVSKVAIVR
ncbi:hypothetical protein BH09BAC3_BH09BAC3_23190 [soil metagenome]